MKTIVKERELGGVMKLKDEVRLMNEKVEVRSEVTTSVRSISVLF